MINFRQSLIVLITIVAGISSVGVWIATSGCNERSDGSREVLSSLRSANERLRHQLEQLKAERSRLDGVVRSVPGTTTVNATGPADKVTLFKSMLREYADTHKAIMSGRLPPRFVQCPVCNGWGNVLQEAVSCFLFALVSRRAVVFDTASIDGYMPFADFLDGDGAHMPFDGYNMRIADKYRNATDPRGKGREIPRDHLICLNYDKDIPEEMVSMQLNYDWWAVNVIVNPHHGEKLLESLPPNYFQLIFEFLWRPNAELQRLIDDFKRQHFGKYTIGIQIRTPTPVSHKPSAVDHAGMPTPPLNIFAQMAEQLSRFQSKVAYEDVVWFVATQNPDFVRRLQAAYGTRKVVALNGTITTTFENSRSGQLLSFLNFYLLGECDDVITTELSSFGTVAASRAGIPAVVCNHHKFCVRRMSPTPCQDTLWLRMQPDWCLNERKKWPHQFMTSVDATCGHFKDLVYNSVEFKTQNWTIKGGP